MIFLETQKDTLVDLSLTTEHEELIEFVFEGMENLKTLVLSGESNFPKTTFDDDFFIRPNMKSLTITAQSRKKILQRGEWLYNILRHVPALEELTLDFYEAFSSDGDFLQNLSFSHLKYIQLKKAHSCLLKHVRLPKLETVCFEEIQGDDIPILMSVRNVIVKKMHIDVHRIGIHFPNIEYLRVEENWDFSYRDVKLALENGMQKLKLLEVARHILPDWMTSEFWKINSATVKVIRVNINY
jgi:hypothetical protein